MSNTIMPVGSVVMLKSGGPKMTITSYQNGVPVCRYWANDKFEELKVFKDNLKLVKEEDI